MVALGGAAVAWARRLMPAGPGVADTGRRSLRLGALAVALGAARAGSLSTSVMAVVPWLALLWSPHATWALALVCALWWHPLPGPSSVERPKRVDRRLAWALALMALLAYGAYSLYFTQMTMLHGDEAPYLAVTQSLLRDGDIDLTNNLDDEACFEYHVRPFGVAKAPASPPGKYHSVHPVGLSALLLPPYYLGLRLWGNPRLACALVIVAPSAACVGLLFTWLRSLGFSRSPALVTTVIIAATAPFFSFSNQLYPEIPALFVALVALVLLSHWQRPGGECVSLGRYEPAILGLGALILTGLCFLHPRFLILGAAVGLPLALQSWHQPRRHASVAALAAGVAIGGVALVWYNLSYSGDWMGAFRPGNAWADDALSPAVWTVSLPGQWLSQRMGLAAVSPVYLLALPGLAFLAVERDRRGLVAAGLYAATAAVNGLHPDWTFGYSYPARFMVCALPALAIGLARFLEGAWGRALPLLALAAAFALSVDTIATTAALPELAYRGVSLAERLFCQYWPWDTFLSAATGQGFPWMEIGFWVLTLGGLTVVWGPYVCSRRGARTAALIGVALLPALWVRATGGTVAFEGSPHMPLLPRDTSEPIGIQGTRVAISRSDMYQRTTGRDHDGAFVARQGQDATGILAAYRLGTLRDGMYSVTLNGASLAGIEDITQGCLTVRRRPTVLVAGPWEERVSLPLQVHEGTMGVQCRFVQRGLSLGYALLAFSGHGSLRVEGLTVAALPVALHTRHDLVRTVDVAPLDLPGSAVACQAFVSGLEPGLHTARFRFSGCPCSALLERGPEPVHLAAYVTPALLRDRARDATLSKWLASDPRIMWHDPDATPPRFERTAPPWWPVVPLAGQQGHELDFTVASSGQVLLLARYSGPHDLQLEGVDVYRLVSW